jgi:cytochrome c
MAAVPALPARQRGRRRRVAPLGCAPNLVNLNQDSDMHDLTQRSLTFAVVAFAALCLGAIAFSTPAAAADGKSLFNAKGCPACHGPTGSKTLQPSYPKLAGQNADYLVAQLKAFKAQERKSAQSALMWGMAAQLSDDDMAAISKYLQTAK